MEIFSKVISVEGERNKKVLYGFGETSLFPEGTKRKVKKYFLFSKKIEEEEIKGSWIVEQETNIEFTNDVHDIVY